MLSVIICSRNPSISAELFTNIHDTVGCDYELIVIDNSNNEYSIFEAYNLGIESSVGNFLCFVHDDIIFHTKGWGEIAKSGFESDKKIGLIGIAGAKIKTKMPSAWWNCEEKYIIMNLKQHFNDGSVKNWNKGNQIKNLEQVVVIDGVFMFAKKVKGIKFNECLSGFHNYDLNLSFEYVQKEYKVMITKDILIEHFSFGNLDSSWYDSAFNIHKIYKNLLPLTIAPDSYSKRQEFKNGSNFILKLIEFKKKKQALYVWKNLLLLQPASRFHLLFLKKIFK